MRKEGNDNDKEDIGSGGREACDEREEHLCAGVMLRQHYYRDKRERLLIGYVHSNSKLG